MFTEHTKEFIIGGSSELPMWLTGCFLVTFFGRWWGAVCIHGNTQILRTLPCGGDIHVWELLTCGGDIHVWELLTCGGGIHVWDLLTCG